MTGRKRGRPKEPTALKVLKGNPGKRPINDEVKPMPLVPKCPSWIHGYAKEEWYLLSDKLERLGLFTEIDGVAFTAYCQAYARWREAEEFLEKFSHDAEGNFNGFMFKTPQGYLQQLPQVSIAQTYAKLMSVYLSKFGLSPSDRAGLIDPKAGEKKTKLSGLLSG